jgi:hypothetical protein
MIWKKGYFPSVLGFEDSLVPGLANKMYARDSVWTFGPPRL